MIYIIYTHKGGWNKIIYHVSIGYSMQMLVRITRMWILIDSSIIDADVLSYHLIRILCDQFNRVREEGKAINKRRWCSLYRCVRDSSCREESDLSAIYHLLCLGVVVKLLYRHFSPCEMIMKITKLLNRQFSPALKMLSWMTCCIKTRSYYLLKLFYKLVIYIVVILQTNYLKTKQQSSHFSKTIVGSNYVHGKITPLMIIYALTKI